MAHERPLDDTSADARETLTRLYARMTPSEKLDRMRAVTRAATQLTLAGLRARNPEASEGMLFLALAKLRLGEDLVRQVYGEGAE